MLKIYTYAGCSTCRRAVKWLNEREIAHACLPIRDKPPSVAEIEAMLEARGGKILSIFNTSGQDYRRLGLSEKHRHMSRQEILKLLAENGNLLKRPFLIDERSHVCLNGFNPKEWEEQLT
jgi:arsenate reductase